MPPHMLDTGSRIPRGANRGASLDGTFIERATGASVPVVPLRVNDGAGARVRDAW
jgi:hypothetical protein